MATSILQCKSDSGFLLNTNRRGDDVVFVMQCVQCSAAATLKCGRCPFVAYCSKECQSLDWVKHQLICGRVYHGEHEDLLWVRGTNSTIFLSCYMRKGRWWLLAKGTQFRQGFVPMSETVDPGITSIAGINFDAISAYPPSMIHGSGQYSMKAKPVSPTESLALIMTQLKEDARAGLIPMAYAFMRVKQYEGDAEEVMPYTKRFRQTQNAQEKERYLATEQQELVNLRRLMAADLQLPAEWDALSDSEKRQSFINLLTQLRTQYGFGAQYGLDMSYLDPSGMQRRLSNPVAEFTRFITDSMSRRTTFIPRVIGVKLFVPQEWSALHKQADSLILDLLNNIDTIQLIYDAAISDRKPVYAMTSADKDIGDQPIPLIIASTNEATKGYRVFEKDPNSELGLPPKIQIGATGANVIIVRSQDKKRLKQLLRSLPTPITDVQIRVDDTVFQ